jgi:hypothetical protein
MIICVLRRSGEWSHLIAKLIASLVVADGEENRGGVGREDCDCYQKKIEFIYPN